MKYIREHELYTHIHKLAIVNYFYVFIVMWPFYCTNLDAELNIIRSLDEEAISFELKFDLV